MLNQQKYDDLTNYLTKIKSSTNSFHIINSIYLILQSKPLSSILELIILSEDFCVAIFKVS